MIKIFINMDSESVISVTTANLKPGKVVKKRRTRRGRKKKPYNIISSTSDSESSPHKVNRRINLAWKSNLRPQTIPAPRPDNFDPYDEWYRVQDSSPRLPCISVSDIESPSGYYQRLFGSELEDNLKPDGPLLITHSQDTIINEFESLPTNKLSLPRRQIEKNLNSDGESCRQSTSSNTTPTSEYDCNKFVHGFVDTGRVDMEMTSASNFDIDQEQSLLNELHSLTKSQLVQKFFELKRRVNSLERSCESKLKSDTC